MTTAFQNWMERRTDAVRRAVAAMGRIAEADENLAALQHLLSPEELTAAFEEVGRQDEQLADAVTKPILEDAMEGGGR